jgi:glycosyltransferase involved in cell wall biosynthesis
LDRLPESVMARLDRTSSVLAVIVHYRYEQWLAQSIESLLYQSHPPAAIVVVDDASPQAPVEIVRQYPDVTLLVAEENRGPYALLQAIFDNAQYNAFALQDADDWSTPDRLHVLLTAADEQNAEMVGCQATSVFSDIAPEPDFTLPRDARSAVLLNPTLHPVLMPTTVISRSLLQRAGGLSAGLRFGGDSEFIRRAIFAGRVINVPERCYQRRVHPGALTRAPATGYGSAARLALQPQLQERARENVARVLAGREPDLRPFCAGLSASLTHVAGPRLHWK